MNYRPQVAVYYFPEYHADPRNDAWHGPGWTEWELVKAAKPRFPGHEQPKVPLWGYLDEAKPETAARQIDAAADHGVDVFLYDWYFYDTGPFLQRALEDGFLQAPNRDRLRFALMWANHDWINIFPLKRSTNLTVLQSGEISEAVFEAATDYMIEHYFRNPCYWRLEGGLYVSFYELASLIRGLHGVAETRRAMDRFREKVRHARLGELHLNAVIWGIQNLPTEVTLENPDAMVEALGFDSVTSYVWIHNVALESYPTVDYPAYADKAIRDWAKFRHEFSVPYFPNVSMGWDASPRTVQTDVHAPLGYPYTPILVGNTPAEFRRALEASRHHFENREGPAVVTINSWNEWTEGSYIEPDAVHGMAYLEAIRSAFGVRENRPLEGST